MDPSSDSITKDNKRLFTDQPRDFEEHSNKRSCITSSEVESDPIIEQIWAKIQPRIEKVVVEGFFTVIWPKIAPSISQQINQATDTAIGSHIPFLLQSLSKSNEIGEQHIVTDEPLELKLRFCNPITSKFYSNDKIIAENGKALRVEIYDVAKSNTVISTGSLSSVEIEFFLLDGDFCSDPHQEETFMSDLKKSTLSSRENKRPLLIGRDQTLYLENGVGFVHDLIVTDNSSWTKSKNFCLGAKIRDENIRIGGAISNRFKVLDERGKGNKKHPCPSLEDEIWQLKGIAQHGSYHTKLSSKGIHTVGDFLKNRDEKGDKVLRKELGNKIFDIIVKNDVGIPTDDQALELRGKRVLDKSSNMIAKNALQECISAPTNDQTSELRGKRVLEKTSNMIAECAHECISVLTNDQTSEATLEWVGKRVLGHKTGNMIDTNAEEFVDHPSKINLVGNEEMGGEAAACNENMEISMDSFSEYLMSTIIFEEDESPISLLHGDHHQASTSYRL